MIDVLNLSLAEVANKIKAREISPVELTVATLDRIEAVEPSINAYVCVTREMAMTTARKAESEITAGNYRGEMHGIPIAVKDLFNIQGMATQCGSRVRHDHVADQDSACVSRLKSAGATILGKTQTHEFAFGITTPTTGNPWNTEMIPGGSSGGSGATVASRGCYMAMGSDTGGSIRIPAAVCGIVGLKPTFGRISRFGVTPLSWSLDHVGPLTRTVRDAAVSLQWLAGHDARDPGSADEPVTDYISDLNKGVKGLSVGVPENYFFDRVDGEIDTTVRTAIDHLQSQGATIKSVCIPGVEKIIAVEYGLAMPEASSYHQKMLRERANLYTEEVRCILEAGEFIPARVYIDALRVRQQIKQGWQTLYDDVDVVIAPTVSTPAVRRGQDTVEWADGFVESVLSAFTRLTSPSNITGLPSIAVPCGFSSDAMPLSFQIIGRPFAEAQILQVAQAYQSAFEWHLSAPPI